MKMFVLLGGPYNGTAVDLDDPLRFLHMVKPIMNDDNLLDTDVDGLRLLQEPEVEVYEKQTRYSRPSNTPYEVYAWVDPEAPEHLPAPG